MSKAKEGIESINVEETSDLKVDSLRCEYLYNPLGIDVVNPRLSWQIRSAQRDVYQIAYQIIVASIPELISQNKGDLWDSGKVDSDQSIDVIYRGKPLKSFVRCYWKVRIWGGRGKVSPWSEPAMWTMGILQPEEWNAKWISYDPPTDGYLQEETGLDFEGSQWIWFPRGNPKENAPQGTYYFRRLIELPEKALIGQAQILFTASCICNLYINEKKIASNYNLYQPTELNVTECFKPGTNLIAIEAKHKEGPAGVIVKVALQVKGEEPLVIISDESWKCSDQFFYGWEKLNFDDSNWKQSLEMGNIGISPWGIVRTRISSNWAQKKPSPILHKTFYITKPVKFATVYICGLGYYELRLNGKKVGDHVLDPAFTRYDKRCLYATYDITSYLKQGKNAIGIMLGNGFYNQHARDAWNFEKAPWRDYPKLLMHMRIEYSDGSIQTVVSDDSWRASIGPILRDGIRNGEYYDARLEEKGWDTPEFDDEKWAPVKVVSPQKGKLYSQMIPPIKVIETIKPIKITSPVSGVYVFDFGQNFAGWVKLKVRGPRGTKITLRYGERLADDGTVSQTKIASLTYQGPFQTDTYILKGEGTEIWEPHFTYHGFRYVEVRGFPGQPTLDNLLGQVVHTAFESAGHFECSNELLNAIQRLTLWSYRSNFLSIPTDCPHREKNGWTGDAHLAAEQAMYNWDNVASYEKWMNDFKDAQKENGELPGIIPTSGWGYGIGPAWDSAYILIPWYLYLYYADIEVLRQHYEGMKKYIDYLSNRAKDYIIDYGLGDWVPAKTETPNTLTSTAYFFVDAKILSNVAQLLNNQEDAQKYTSLAENIRKAFNRHFYRGNGIYANGSITALSCALYQGLVEEKERDLVIQRLIEKLDQENWKLDVGILGAKYLFHALTENGRVDVAYKVAIQTEAPSYGNWVKRGATTLWEDWYGNNSLNHIMFGDISAWFYKALAGISPDPSQPGFKHIIIHPRLVNDLKFVNAWHKSMYGLIKVQWLTENNNFHLDITIPANSWATVYLPATDIKSITESGAHISKVEGVQILRVKKNNIMLNVKNGSYSFQSILRK
ncbi:MAG: family 78 glycoside hydrolase catalytic domain [Thermoproteota archaeon]